MNRYYVFFLVKGNANDSVDGIKNHIKSLGIAGVSVPISMPHITIIPPFYTDDIDIVYSVVKSASLTSHFNVILDGISSFDKRVLYINVSDDERLVDIRNKIYLGLCNSGIISDTRKDWNPHVTLARIKSINAYNKIIEKISDYKVHSEYTVIDGIAVMVWNGREWIVHKEHTLII
ncbi:MAG: 2'-5' RNA ligase family protein [Candidatus Woesearchaeota archaeon]